jgi:hypothetical protein
MLKDTGSLRDIQFTGQGGAISRKMVIAILLGVALIAFEIFNFDTTQYALTNLLGEIRFVGVLWASILAVAFCAIDFAGLVRIFTPQRGAEEPRAVWFLTGAWFLGTIANAVMTWWAVSLTLLGHEFGNEVLSREMLLRYVPIFVAMLVWLTRILFIGAFSVAGEEVFDRSRADAGQAKPAPRPAQSAPARAAQPAAPRPASSATPVAPKPRTAAPAPSSAPSVTYEPVDDAIVGPPPAPKTNANGPMRPTSRIQQRPPMPGSGVQRAPGNMHAQGKNRS